jgi:phosphate-selective porin OprO and OprP
MTLKHSFMGAVAGSLLLGAFPAAAQTNDQLQQQIQQLQRQLQNVQDQVNKQAAQPPAAAQPAPAAGTGVLGGLGVKATLSPSNRPGICTLDDQNCIELTGRLHFDFGDYLSVHPQSPTGPHSLTSGVNARRARLGVLGKFAGDWNYAFILDFGGSTDSDVNSVTGSRTTDIENAFITYNGFRPVAIDLGYLDVPFTLDEATSSNDIMFIERAEIQNTATNLAANDARAALGVRSNNDRYWAGVYLTGPTAGATHTGSNQQQLGGTARATYQILQGSNYSLHIGADGEYVFTPRSNGSSATSTASNVSFSDRPELRVDPTAFINTGAIPAKNAGSYGGELAGGFNSLFFQGEYYRIFIDQSGLSATAPKPELNFDGGYVQASWTITGENRRYIPTTGAYSGIRPDHPVAFGRGGGWGAWEVAVRYSEINLNNHATPGVSPLTTGGVFGGRANGYVFGINWYPIYNVRFMLNYIHEDVYKTPVATAGGTTSGGVRMDAIALRTQIAF